MDHLTFSENVEGTDYIIGDIHGEYSKFNQVLLNLNFNKDVDRMFSVGDLIDRGPNSPACLKLLQESWFFAVKGNHEDMMNNRDDTSSNLVWMDNGGSWNETISDESIFDLGKDMPITITINTPEYSVGISHADYLEKSWNTRESASEMLLIWSRRTITNYRLNPFEDIKPVEDIDYVVHGHSVVQHPILIGNRYFIDTGACFDDYGKLSVLELLKSDLKLHVFENFED